MNRIRDGGGGAGVGCQLRHFGSKPGLSFDRGILMHANFCIAFSLALCGLACASGNADQDDICAEGLKLIGHVLRPSGALTFDWAASLSSLSSATSAMFRLQVLQHNWMLAELYVMESQLAMSSSDTDLQASVNAAREAKDAYDNFRIFELPIALTAPKEELALQAYNVVQSFAATLRQDIASSNCQSVNGSTNPKDSLSTDYLNHLPQALSFDTVAYSQIKSEMQFFKAELFKLKDTLLQSFSMYANAFKTKNLQYNDIALVRQIVSSHHNLVLQILRKYCIWYVADSIASTQLDIYLRAQDIAAAVLHKT